MSSFTPDRETVVMLLYLFGYTFFATLFLWYDGRKRAKLLQRTQDARNQVLSSELYTSARHGFSATQSFKRRIHSKTNPVQVVVVGSGPAGLATASSLAKNGKNVIVLEQNKTPGGGLHSFPGDQAGISHATGLHYLGKTDPDWGWREFLRKCTPCAQGVQFVEKRALAALPQEVGCSFPKPSPFSSAPADDVSNSATTYDIVSLDKGESYISFSAGAGVYERALGKRFPLRKKTIKAYMSLLLSLNAHPQASLFFRLKCIQLSSTSVRRLQRCLCGDFLRYADRTVVQVLRDDLGVEPTSALFAALVGQFGTYGTWPSSASFYVHAVTVGHYLDGAVVPSHGPEGMVRSLLASIRYHHQVSSSSEKPKGGPSSNTTPVPPLAAKAQDVFCRSRVVGLVFDWDLLGGSDATAEGGAEPPPWQSYSQRLAAAAHGFVAERAWREYRREAEVVASGTAEDVQAGNPRTLLLKWMWTCLRFLLRTVRAKGVLVREKHDPATTTGTSGESETAGGNEAIFVPATHSVVFATSSAVTQIILASSATRASLARCACSLLGLTRDQHQAFLSALGADCGAGKILAEEAAKYIASGKFCKFQALAAPPLSEGLVPRTGFFQAFVTLEKEYEYALPSANVWEYSTSDFEANYTSMLKSAEKGLDCDLVVFLSSQPSPSGSATGPKPQSFCVLVPVLLSWVSEWSHLSQAQRSSCEPYQAWKRLMWEKVSKTKSLENFAPRHREHTFSVTSGSPLSSVTYLGSASGDAYGTPCVPERFSQTDARNVLPRTLVPNVFQTGQDVVTAGVAGALYSAQITTNCVLGFGSLLDVLLWWRKPPA